GTPACNPEACPHHKGVPGTFVTAWRGRSAAPQGALLRRGGAATERKEGTQPEEQCEGDVASSTERWDFQGPPEGCTEADVVDPLGTGETLEGGRDAHQGDRLARDEA